MTQTPAILPHRDELLGVLDLVRSEAARYLQEMDSRPVRLPEAEERARSLDGAFPQQGPGALAALRELIEVGRDAWINSAGPRFYHYVIGGGTPAALGADMLAPVYDQLSSSWITSPLAVQLELTAMRWLRDLFGLRPEGAGVMTTGAMMANYNGLAAARQWCGEQVGIDVAEDGCAGLDLQLLSSGHLHATCYKALAMLGHGRKAARTFAADARGRVDLAALEQALAERADAGKPSILVANAGEVNAGDFDPIEAFADLADAYGAWLHVDGAFGLFAAVSAETAYLTKGVERARSVTVDGHKWMNVPYDCGMAFVDDPSLWARTFRMDAHYLPDAEVEADPIPCYLCAESSRRARSLAVWATLRAYGRAGVRDIVERNLAQAQLLARRIDAEPDFERLAEVPLNIVCFRFHPQGVDDPARLDQLNRQLGAAILADGRVFSGLTTFCGKVALRPAIVNWRTGDGDIEAFVAVLRELGAGLR